MERPSDGDEGDGAEGSCKGVGCPRLWRRDADGVGAAGADGAARSGLAALVQADFDGSEIVVAATEGERGRWDLRIGLSDEVEDLCGRKRDLAIELGEGGWHGERTKGGSGCGEKGVGGEAGTGAVGAPLVS